MNFRSKLKGFYKRLIFRLSAGNNPLYTGYYRYFYYPEPGTLDHFTSEFSRLHKGLTVVQIGANDGIHNDPIHRYIKRDKWRGVLLEPLPDVFAKSLEPLYRRQKGIVTVNAALDHNDGTSSIYRVAFSDSRWATGLTSFNRKILEGAIASGYIAKQAAKEGTTLPQTTDEYIREEKIECLSVNTLLKRYDIDKVDWLQIDTEGYDFEIIKIFNIEVTKPTVIVYENLHLSKETQDECRRHLTGNGYMVRDFGPNTLAARDLPDKLDLFFTLES